MRRRWSAAAAVLLAAALSGPAQAQPPVCDLVRDARDDVRVYGTQEKGEAASVDVLSADIASSKSRVVVAFRVAGLDDAPPAGPALARVYRLSFPGREGGTWSFEARLDGATPPHATDGWVGFGDLGITNNVPAQVVVDAAHREVRVVAAVKDVTTLAKLPRTAGPLQVGTHLRAQASYVSFDVLGDAAEGRTSYRFGTPSCLRV